MKTVKDVMSTLPISVSETTSFQEIAARMRECRVSAFPVLDADGKVTGVVSEADLLVLGSRHRGWLRRLAPGSVARAVARRTCCPVVIVPEPPPRVLPVPWPDESGHGHWFRRRRGVSSQA